MIVAFGWPNFQEKCRWEMRIKNRLCNSNDEVTSDLQDGVHRADRRGDFSAGGSEKPRRAGNSEEHQRDDYFWQRIADGGV